jgi:phage-related minor tail protein
VDKIILFLKGVLAYLLKNSGLIVGVIEAVLKALGGIVSLTPSKKDDAVVAFLDTWFTKIKGWVYNLMDKVVK